MGTNKMAPGEELPGEIPEGHDETGKLPDRLNRYGIAHARSVDMLEYLRDQGIHERERAQMADCGNYLVFNHYYTVGKVRLAAMHSCKKHLLCPLCAIRRGAKKLGAYLDRFQVIQEENPTLRPYLVSFTVRNGDDLDERYRHLSRSLSQLHNRRRHWNKGTRRAKWTEAAHAQGAVWTYEVTNKGNGWHPHVHAIWLCEKAPNQRALRAEWEAITGDSHQVDVRPIDQKNHAEGFAEVFKYAVKFGDMSLPDTVTAYQTLRGRRLLSSFGSFRGVKVPDDTTDDLLDDLPYMELFYRYLPGLGYSCQSVRPGTSNPTPTASTYVTTDVSTGETT